MRNDANCEGPGTPRGSPDVHQTAPSRTLQNPSENQKPVLFGSHRLQGPLEKHPFSTTHVHEICALRQPHKSAPGCSQERNSRICLQHFHQTNERNMVRKHPASPLASALLATFVFSKFVPRLQPEASLLKRAEEETTKHDRNSKQTMTPTKYPFDIKMDLFDVHG